MGGNSRAWSEIASYRDRNLERIKAETELKHHGVKGQKWGVRRYQNYDGTLIGSARGTGSAGSSAAANTNSRDHSQSDKSQLAMFLVSVTLHAVTLNPYGIARDIYRGGMAAASAVKTSKYNRERAKSPIDEETGFHKKKTPMSESDDMARVNPSVYNFDKNTKNNCMLCTCTYDLRRRGYDVTANKASRGFVKSDLNYWYPKAEIKEVSAKGTSIREARQNMATQLKSELVSQGDGARGNLMVSWSRGGGHSMVYEISNGSLVIRDAQINKTYKNPDKILSQCKSSVSYARLDNVDIDKKLIREVAT